MRMNKLAGILIMTIITLDVFSGAAWAGWTFGSSTIYTTTDNVGIGTSSPSTSLDVEGNLLLNDEVCSISSNLSTIYVHNYQAELNDSKNYGYVRGHYFKTTLPAGKQVGDSSNSKYIYGLYSKQIVEASHLYGNSFGIYGCSYAEASGHIHGNSVSVYGQGAINETGHVYGDLIGVYGDVYPSKGQVDGKRWAGYFNGNTYIKGNLGIGYTNPDVKLAVNGTIKAREVRVTTSGWSDFVFDKGYKLPSLDKVESYINENKHLPDVPSAQEVQMDGINVTDMMARQMQKIEELTLYMIELKKENEALKKDNQAIKERLSRIDNSQHTD